MSTTNSVTLGAATVIAIMAAFLVSQHNQLAAQAEQMAADSYQLKVQRDQLQAQGERLQAQPTVAGPVRPDAQLAMQELPAVVVSASRR